MPKMQRVDDCHTMDKVLEIKWTKGELVKFQTCRMHLQVCSVACVVTMTGDTMEDWAMNGHLPDDRRSPWPWPQLERPPDNFWTKWKEMLQKMTLHPRSNKLRRPLGRWADDSHQEWKFQCNPMNNILLEQINRDQAIMHEHAALCTRNKKTFCSAGAVMQQQNVALLPASVTVSTDGMKLITKMTHRQHGTTQREPTNFKQCVKQQPPHIR